MAYAGLIVKGMRKGAAIFSGLLGLGTLLYFYPLGALTLAKDDQIIFLKKVDPGDTFQLAFLHSIALSEVRDFFIIDSEYRMVLTETRFQGQGAGLPYGLSRGEQLHREGDWFRITGMERVVPSIPWRIQSQWRNRFRFGNESELDFSVKVGDALIDIRIQKMNLFSFLRICLQSKNF